MERERVDTALDEDGRGERLVVGDHVMGALDVHPQDGRAAGNRDLLGVEVLFGSFNDHRAP